MVLFIFWKKSNWNFNVWLIGFFMFLVSCENTNDSQKLNQKISKYRSLGLEAYTDQNYLLSCSILDSAVRLGDSSYNTLFCLALSYSYLDSLEKGASYYRKALSAASNYSDTLSVYINVFENYIDLGNLSAAKNIAEKILYGRERNIIGEIQQSRIENKKGRHIQAIQILDNVLIKLENDTSKNLDYLIFNVLANRSSYYLDLGDTLNYCESAMQALKYGDIEIKKFCQD